MQLTAPFRGAFVANDAVFLRSPHRRNSSHKSIQTPHFGHSEGLLATFEGQNPIPQIGFRIFAAENRITNLKTNIMSEIQNKVTEIIVDKLGVKAAEVTPEANFTAHLGADSLDTVELIMEFEKEFGIEISDDDAQQIQTVGDVIAYLEKHVQ